MSRHKKKPSSPLAFEKAASLQRQGRFQEAEHQYRAILERKPDDPKVHNNLGVALQWMGRLDEAAACYERAVAIAPNYADPHYNLGNILVWRQQPEAAVASYQRAISIQPNHVQAHFNCGHALAAMQRWQEAARAYARSIDIQPNVDAYLKLGNVLVALDGLQQAITCYERGLALEPHNAVLHYNIANVLALMQRHDEAIASFDRAIALDPGYADAHNNRGNSLEALQRDQEAIACYEKAIAIDPFNVLAYNNMGNMWNYLGNQEKAQQCLARAIELAPTRGEFYRNLGECKRFTADDVQVGAMRELVQDASLPPEDQMHLRFALGKALQDLQEYEESFLHLLVGNAIKRRGISYNEAVALQEFDRIITSFSATLMRQKQHLGVPSAVPVFIIGMLRSGTTLVEQILSSHPKVFGAGELEDFAQAVISELPIASYPEAIGAMQGEQLLRIGTRYIERIRTLAPDAERIVDKMPENFRFAGLIHLAVPNARLIHTVRDAVDTCVSCFSKLFPQGQAFTYDLAELGRYYRAYEALMAHWREVLPAGCMLEVRYEDVVADVEKEARRIVSHCGLEWDDACLTFYRTSRKVRTTSAHQVRQPIYSTSIQRWQPYRELLQPLLQALGINWTKPG